MKFTFEAAEQDGYSFRAVEVWPADQEPVRNHDEVSGASSAYHSTLTLTFDDDDETRGLALDARARTRQAAGMADPRYAVPLDEFVAGAQIAREEQVEEHAERVVPTPAHGDRLPYGDGMTGDVDGD